MGKEVDNKSSVGLSKSTKTLLIVVVAIMAIVVIFLVAKGLSNKNNNTNENETTLNSFSADLQISQVQVINSTDLSVKVDEGTVEGELKAVNFIFYDENGKEIKRSQISISNLENNDYLISFKLTNTSKVESISITPVFLNKSSGGSVVGKVEDEYTMTGEENTNNNEGNNQENTSNEENNSSEIPPECTSDTDCNDNNSCTTNTCNEGNCSYTLITECVPCSISSQCDDSNSCTANVCSYGKCSYPAIPGCTPCGTSLNCEDNNSCTNNLCMQGRCLFSSMADCQSCTLDSECEDNDACTSNTCYNGACTFPLISNCKVCTLTSQCEDNDSSTIDSCSGNKCVYTKITSCISNDKYCPSGCTATNDNDCSYICGNGIREGNEKCDLTNLGGATCSGVLGSGYGGTLKCYSGLCTFDTSLCVAPCTCGTDNNVCTTDQCVSGVCQHTAISGCCTSASQCNDNNICTTDSCSGSNSCTHASISNCCTSNSQCGSGKVCTGNVCVTSSNPPSCTCGTDNNICTTDVCVSGVCQHTAISGCCTSSSQCQTNQVCTGNICVTSSTPPTSTTGKIYYVAPSPTGNDNTGNGSIQKPWFTLEKAWNYVSEGDTIYMRGGTYSYVKQTLGGKSGSSGKMINVFNYPGENPIITKSSSYAVEYPMGLIIINDGNYLHFKGLEISHFDQEDNHVWPGFWVFKSAHSIFESLNIHDCGEGAVFENIDDCLIINSDFHNNYDPLTDYDPYGNADGLDLETSAGTTNTVRGCRFWSNSDDGFDGWWSVGFITIDNCWSWKNGYREDGETKGGNGEGFKIGDTNVLGSYPNTHLRTITNSLAFDNREGGFVQEEASYISWMFNNIGYHNADQTGYRLNFEFSTYANILRNNIAFANQNPSNVQASYDNAIEDHNSWDDGFTVTNADFLSLDSSCMDDERKADGSLPDCDFLHLKQGSHLIDAGVAISGMTSDGYGHQIVGNPDIGAYEYSSSTPVCTCPSDNNVCTTDICQSNVCQHIQINNCCTSNSQCGSNQVCTGNVCTSSSSNPIPSALRTFYVNATTGSDNNNGLSPSSPWKTLSKVNSQTFRAGDAILFKRGDTWYGSLTISSSGSSSNPIIFSAYGTGDKPLITGFTTITGWTNEGNGIYSKSISTQSTPNMVTVDDVNTMIGRYPDYGWLTYEGVGSGYITDNQLSSSTDWTGADVVIKTEGYVTNRLLITDHSGTTIKYSSNAYDSKGDSTGMALSPNHAGWGYFIEHDLRTLTTLGEWYYDDNTNKFYMYFGAVDPKTKTVKVSSLDNGAIINANYITFDNINFKGFSKTGLDARRGNYFTATNCETGFTGVYSVFPSPNCKLDNCYFHDTNADCIYGTESGLTLTNSVLENIGIHEGAWYGWDADGEGISNGGSNILVQYNTFRNIGQDGLFLSGDNVKISNNLFDNCSYKSFDQGAIYMNGIGSNRVISNNIIINTIGSASGTTETQFPNQWVTAEGIYLDEPCSGVIIENNTVANIHGGCGIKLHEAHDIIIRHNTIYNAFEGYQFLGSGAQPNDPIRNVDMDDNIVVAMDSSQFVFVFMAHTLNDINQFGTSNGQYYVRPINDGTMHDFWTNQASDGDWGNFRAWATSNPAPSGTWQAKIGQQDLDSHFYEGLAASSNDIRFEYNAAKTSKVITLSGNYKDVKGNSYSGSVTLAPYTSVVLVKS